MAHLEEFEEINSKIRKNIYFRDLSIKNIGRVVRKTSQSQRSCLVTSDLLVVGLLSSLTSSTHAITKAKTNFINLWPLMQLSQIGWFRIMWTPQRGFILILNFAIHQSIKVSFWLYNLESAIRWRSMPCVTLPLLICSPICLTYRISSKFN